MICSGGSRTGKPSDMWSSTMSRGEETTTHRPPRLGMHSAPAAGASAGRRTKRRILVVEDEKDIVDLLIYNLTRNGYEVLSASNGNQAIDLATKELPDLIVLDLMLPGIDG